jgi:hypothetical protein
MKLVLGILSGVLGLLAFVAMGVATAGAVHAGQGNSPLADGGAIGLVLMFLAGLLMKWRERF